MSEYPIFTPDMLNDIGITVKEKHRRLVTSIVILRKAATIDPMNHRVMTNLAHFLSINQQYDEALVVAERAVQIDPMAEASHVILGGIYSALGRYADAIQAINRGVAMGSNSCYARFDRGLCHLAYGNWVQGFKDYEALREYPDRPKVKTDAPYWRGEDLTGKTLWVVAEQGAGDTIMVSRFLEPPAFDTRVVFDCPPEMVSLFKHLPVEVRPASPKKPNADPGCDYYCYAMSLPGALEVTPGCLSRYKYGSGLKETAERSDVEVPVAPSGLIKTGICWGGGPWQQDDFRRSMPLKTFLPLLSDPRFAFYSLQVGRQDEIGLNKAESLLVDLAPNLECWADTAGAIAKMDLVITVCTGVAHLAGALGVPTFLMLPWSSHWVWGRSGSISPWYPSMRLFRQTVPNSWLEVLAAVQDAMFDMADAKEAAA